MRWVNFIIFNAVAPIENLDAISDAGAGKGLMNLTPVRDCEMIACGRANTPLNGVLSPSPVLKSGSVSPAILVRGLLLAIKALGYKVRVHCYQLGLAEEPDFTGLTMNEVVVHHCLEGDEARLIHSTLVPELSRQHQMGELNVIAECGVGGTAYAALWLQHWLQQEVSLAGSTKDQQKLAIKRKLINKLAGSCRDLPRNVELFTANRHLSDPIQRALCAMLTAPSLKNNQLLLAGGAMFFAPLIALPPSSVAPKLALATTKWVLDVAVMESLCRQLKQTYPLAVSVVDFNQSQYPALHLYEQGFVVEGCGLGGCLVLAEELGVSSADIIQWLDEAVAPWLK